MVTLSEALANAILARDLPQVKTLIQQGASLTEQDPYGFTPLEEAAIADSLEITTFLLEYTQGRSLAPLCSRALVWAVDNENAALARLLLSYGADPNYYTSDGKPVLAGPLLKEQQALIDLLVSHGGDLGFAKDYITVKLIGHRFELTDRAEIVDPTNTFLVVGYEGFFPEVTLNIIRQSLDAFMNHYEAREYHFYRDHFLKIEQGLLLATQLRQLKHYQVSPALQRQEAAKLASRSFWILPVSFKGHAITLVRMGEWFSICDRRQDTPVEGKVILYKITRPQVLTAQWLHRLLYQPMDFKFFDRDIHELLRLVPKLAFPTHSQLAGNCSWANVEAAVLVALFCLLTTKVPQLPDEELKKVALEIFGAWQEWDKDHALYDCIYDFERLSKARQACRVSLLAAVFFQRLDPDKKEDLARAKQLVPYLKWPEYRYVLDSYKRVYANPKTGDQFPKFIKLLKKCGLKPGLFW